MPEFVSSAEDFRELGDLGLKQQSGFVIEDYLPKLKHRSKRLKVYKEMREDPIIGAILFAIEMHLRRSSWKIEGGDEETKKFVEDCVEDMSHTYQDFLSEALSMLPYGFSIHEIVYKLRDDGRVGWKKLPIRAQDSIDRWDFDNRHGLNGVYQRRTSDFQTVFIPSRKMLLFRPSSFKSNPEGRSIFRSAWKPYYFKKKLETIEAIGIERDLSGYPTLSVPGEIFGKSDEAQERREYAEKIVTRVRKDEQMGAVLPPNWELELLSAQGTRNVDVDQVITRYSIQMAQSLLSDVIMLGHYAQGSYGLSEQKYELFVVALDSWLESIDEVFNKYAIPRLLRLNGITDEARYPKMGHNEVGKIDGTTLANALFRLSNVNMIQPDNELEKYLRNFFGLPQKDLDSKRPIDPDTEHEYGYAPPGDNGRTEADTRTREDNTIRPSSAEGDYTQDTQDHARGGQ